MKVNFNRFESKAPRLYTSKEDIAEMFDAKPDRLVSYIVTAVRKKLVVPTLHMIQLAKKVGMPLVHHGRKLGAKELSAWMHVAPANIGNIEEITDAGRMMFPGAELLI